MRSIFSFLIILCSYNLLEARVIPLNYDLRINLNPSSGLLNGTVKSRIFVEEASDILEFSSHVLTTFSNVTITKDKNSTLFTIKKTERERNITRLILEQKLVKNASYLLTLEFHGVRAEQNPRNSSFYIINGTDKATNRSTLFAIIDLTKNSSQSVFPSFSGPKFDHLRTPFNLTIIRPKSFKIVTISNVSLSKQINPDYQEDTYSSTIPLRLQSFALIMTNSSSIIQLTKRELNSSCPDERFIFGVNKNVIKCAFHYLSEFYGTTIPANGFSLIGTPARYNISIDSFGLKVVSEENLNKTDSPMLLESILYRLSEQWWSYIPESVQRSKESLVSALSWLAAYETYPKIIRKSNASEYENFLTPIELVHTYVIREEWIRCRNATENYFSKRDLLTLNMIKNILGTKLFTKGLAEIFAKRYNPLKEEDIWRHLTEVASKNGTFNTPDFPKSVEEIVKPFRNRSLFSIPALHLDFDTYGSFGGYIIQKPYAFTKTSFDLDAYKNTTGKPIWKVPIQVVVVSENGSKQQKPLVWTKTENRTISLTNISQKDILLLNPDFRGPFLLSYMYKKNNWGRIFERFDALEIKYKVQLIHDLHVITESLRFNYNDSIKYLLKITPSKSNLPLLKPYLKFITDIELRLSGKALNLTSQLFVKQITEFYVKHLNNSAQQPFWIKNLKHLVLEYLCKHNSSICTCKRMPSYQELTNNIKYHSKNQYVYLCSGVRNVTQAEWMQLLNNVTNGCKNYTSSCVFLDGVNLLIDCTRNQEAISNFLNSLFRKQSNVSCLSEKIVEILEQIKKTYNGSSILLNAFARNWKEIVEKYDYQLDFIARRAFINLKTEKQSKDALDLLKSDPFRQSIKCPCIVENNIDRVQGQLLWNNHTLPDIEKMMLQPR